MELLAPIVYIIADKNNSYLKVGVLFGLNALKALCTQPTNLFKGRVKLVYFEVHYAIQDACAREAHLQAGIPEKTSLFVSKANYAWRDLSKDLFLS